MWTNLHQAARRNFLDAAHAVRRAPASTAFWRGMYVASGGALLGVAAAAFAASTAQRGELLPTFLGRAAGLVAYPALSGAAALGVAGAIGVSFPGIGLLGAVAALYPEVCCQTSLVRLAKTVNAEGVRLRHLEFGGTYHDTASAQTMRQRALAEMSGAFAASRTHLGYEAALLHR